VAYVFDPAELHAIVRDVVGPPIEELIPPLLERLVDRWPKHINPNLNWVLNNAGGAMGMMTFLHASVTEYLIIFGSPIGTEGHTGRFVADDYFMILDGEQWAYSPGELERRVYRAGDSHHLPKGYAGGYRMPDKCWALEYARGFIPAMLPFGTADTFSSTLDLRSTARAYYLYGTQAVRQLARGKV